MNMEKLRKLLSDIMDENLLQIILSGRRTEDAYTKIRVRPMKKKGELIFQAAAWDGKKEFHFNCEKEDMISRILAWMERDFRQLQGKTATMTCSALVSKKGKVTVKTKKRADLGQVPELTHDRAKKYILNEGIPVPFLVYLGVMTPEGKVIAQKYDKFRQINRFLEFIEDICPMLPADREIMMIDFGCGKSYLTFAMYYYLHELKGYDVRITGLDLKEDVIARCNELAREFGYEKLQFLQGDIAQYEGVRQVDLVVTLHACDTATDYALAKAVEWNAGVILSVPCCQHELNGQIRSELLEPVLKYGLLKERMAALITDGLRASMLEEAGYQVQVLEFIDMEHTPKNILIRAVKKGDGAKERSEELKELMEFLNVSPTLDYLLKFRTSPQIPEKDSGLCQQNPCASSQKD